jgi:ParB-like chromosome segregation protein Spo0J
MKAKLQIEYWPIERLRPYAGNPRKNDAQAVEKMRQSIREYGFAVPVLAKTDGEVIDGHLRLKGGIAEGMTEVPVIPSDDWTPAQVKAFRLMANRSVNWSAWDEDLLRVEFGELKALDFDCALTGFDVREFSERSANGDSAPAIGDLEYRIVIDCASEAAQAEMLERFTSEGLTCRALIS